MKRRTILKAGSAGIGATVLGGAALMGTAAAEVSTGLFEVQESYSIDSESGRLEHLTLTNINVVAEWENFDHPVANVDWTLEAEVEDGDGNVVSDTIGTASASFEEPDEYSGSAARTMENVDLVSVFGQDYFEVESVEEYDGEDVTEQFDVSFTLTATVTDVQDNTITESVSGGTDLGVTNLGADTNIGGNGTIDHGDEDGGDYESPEPTDTPTEEPPTDTPTEEPPTDTPTATPPSVDSFSMDNDEVAWSVSEGGADITAITLEWWENSGGGGQPDGSHDVTADDPWYQNDYTISGITDGSYTVTLTIEDSNGNTDSDTVSSSGN